MISNKAISFVVSLIAVVFTVAPAYAQYQTSGSTRFNIPFAFLAGEQALPAGEYFVKLDGFHRAVLQCRLSNCGAAVLIAFNTDKPATANAEKGTLLFEQYGDLYALHAVRLTYGRDWNQLVLSHRAVEAAKAHPSQQLAIIPAQ